MFLMILQLTSGDYLEEVLLALTTADIGPVTLVDGVNSHNMMESAMPVFSGIFPDSQRSQYAKILMAPVGQEKDFDGFLEVLALGGVSFEKQELGAIHLLPVARTVEFKGLG